MTVRSEGRHRPKGLSKEQPRTLVFHANCLYFGDFA